MDVRKFRAPTMQAALRRIREELGAEAAVLHTREVKTGGLFGLWGERQVEVTASLGVHVPSRLPASLRRPALRPTDEPLQDELLYDALEQPADGGLDLTQLAAPADNDAPWSDGGVDLELSAAPPVVLNAPPAAQAASPHAMREAQLRRPTPPTERAATASSTAAFQLFTDLIEAGVEEPLAREVLLHVQRADADDIAALHIEAARWLEREVGVHGPIQLPRGQQRLVALVGPTGVGKTTTIAKLAANFRLREKRRVGLITVDTYRIAAVEQLGAYAEIIDLPMEVVASPREMHAALQRMQDLDLILMDTAGRSPRDEIKIQELKRILQAADADEVHLVLSSVSGTRNLARAVEQFRPVGLHALLLTKLDETDTVGHLLSAVRAAGLPLSYTTHGQNVPNDIAPACAKRLVETLFAEAAPAANSRLV